MKSCALKSAYLSVIPLLLVLATDACAYTYQMTARAPKTAFVGQNVGVTLQFTLETFNAPPGIIFNSERFDGNVNFGNGDSQRYRASLSTPRDGYVQSTLTRTSAYQSTGTYQITTTGNLHDEVCLATGCLPFDRVVAPISSNIVVYSPGTTMDAVRSYLDGARATLMELGNPNPSDLDIARLAYSRAIIARSQNASTSQDPALRDAEYMLRGYAGGLLLRTADPTQIGGGGTVLSDFGNDLANITGPVGAALYNLGKIVVHGLGGSVSTDGLPPSAPGGIEANGYGFWAGVTGKTPGELSSSSAYSNPINRENTSPESPITPDANVLGNGSNVDPIRLMNFDVDPDSTYYLDPNPGRSLAFAVAGNAFRSVTLPGSIFTSDQPYKIVVGQSEFAILPDVEFNLTQYFSNGVAGFAITGVPADFDGDAAIGTRFMDPGRVFVAAQEFVALQAVPEPSTFVIFALGLTILLRLRLSNGGQRA